MKSLQLSKKEIARASNDITTVARPQSNGLYFAAVVRVSTGLPVFNGAIVEKGEIGRALQSDLRMIDKCGFDCPMADAARHRV